MLNSIEYKNLIAHMYENIKKFSIFQAQIGLECYFFLLIDVKMPTVVGILTLMSKKKFMLSCVEHEKSFIASGPDLQYDQWQHILSYLPSHAKIWKGKAIGL